ncbi:MAG: cytochrome P450 [Halioglobus sp.]
MRLFDPAIADNPYPHYQHWRENQPVFRDEESRDWIISRHEDVVAALKNHKLFSSSAFAESEQSAVALPLLSDDPPRHTKLRALVNRAFTSRTLKDIEGGIEQLSHTMAEAVKSGTAVDIAQIFTVPLPVAVISQMMDIPSERGEDFKRWSDALTGTSEAEDMAERMPDIMEMAGFFSSLIPGRRSNPGDDLISKIVNAEVDGERLSDEDIAGFCMLLLIAGNETTTNLLSNLLHHAASNPGLWEALRADRSKIDAAIEETFRFDAPVQFVFRTITEDMSLHGQNLSAGDMAILVMGSANRDIDQHEAPDEFRLDRTTNSHLTLGHGIHFCIGAPLGRMEARLALGALLDRFKSIRHAPQENVRTHSHMLRGFHHLWLEFEAA